MQKFSNSPTQQRHGLICPITLDVYRDPVLAGDGHVYERTAIIKWIEQQGTSPLTRLPLNIDDLRPAENIKQLCESYRTNAVIYSLETSETSSPPSSTLESNTDDKKQRIICKQNCNTKRILLIILAICVVASPFILATSIIFSRRQSNLIPSNVPTYTQYPANVIYPPTTYILPNNCTLPNIAPLFSWSNVKNFSFTYYSKLYTAVSNQTILTFAFRNDPSYWCLDNVSVFDISSKIELIIDGQFNNDTTVGFIRCNPYGNISTPFFLPPAGPYNGKRSFCDGSVGLPDYLSATLNTTIGQIYQVSFWLQNKGHPPNGAQVVMSY